MPYPGYLQDLSQLEDQECLLPISNEDLALTNAQLLELELSRPPDLGSSTASATILPQAAVKPTEDVKADIESKIPFTLLVTGNEAEASDNTNSPLILTPSTVPSPTDTLLPDITFPSPQVTSTQPINGSIDTSVKKDQQENALSASTQARLQPSLRTNVSLLADLNFSSSPSDAAKTQNLLGSESRLPFDFELPVPSVKEAKSLWKENTPLSTTSQPEHRGANASLLVDLKFPPSPDKGTKNQMGSNPSAPPQTTLRSLLETNARLLLDLKFSPPRPPTLNTANAFALNNITNSQPAQNQINDSGLFGLVFENKVKQQALPMAILADPVLPDSPPATTLATRTTEDVIAELKEARSNATDVKAKLRLDPYISKHPGISDFPGLTLDAPIKNNTDENDENDEIRDDDEDSEDDIQPTVKPRKITERKRRLNAIADSYIQKRNLKSLKEGNKIRPEEESQQSARWLVNQSENRVIISSPREYQVELFEKAKEKNIIAVLDTGTGKTLIAVLLLRHVFAQELEDRALGRPKRVSFFLVDSVQLVFQQHAVLKANLDQPMDMFCGEMGCDMWSKKHWEDIYSKNMVIVCTAEVLRQCLHRSFISMDRINLLIFDEAHHAKKDHPYARIIKDFYVGSENGAILPKIFGMTASPVDAIMDVAQAAAELEAILHAQIATTADPSFMQYRSNDLLEKAVPYQVLGPKFETALFSQMRERFKANLVLAKPLVFALQATRELGTWCADQVWPFCLTEEETQKLQAKTERRYHAKKIQEPLEILEARKAQLREAKDIVAKHTFDPPDLSTLPGIADGPAFLPASVPLPEYRALPGSTNLSSKVVNLIHLLQQRFHRQTDDKCIVFVNQRYTARLLAKLFTQPGVGTPHLFVGTLVGTRTGEAGDLNASFRDQVVTMMKFRNGIINCLFATSVAEEGLDIPGCNLIIRFDLYTTLIQYIQSRGRARHANSRYMHMFEQGNQEHMRIMRNVRRDEGILKTFCSALPENRKLTGNDFNMDYFLAKEKSHRVYKTPAGAKLTYKMSLMVLANFVDSLPHGMDVSLQPEYVMTNQGQNFVCEVILPEESPIHGAIGRPASTKQVAKCSAAFETCLELIKGKYLDESLCPTFTKQLPAMRNAVLAIDSKKREAYDMKTKPEIWSVSGYPEQLFITVLQLENPEALDRPSQPLALLTRSRLPELPSFNLHFGQNRHSSIKCSSLTTPIQITPSIVGQINTFTICFFDDVFSKLYESDPSKMPYFLVPINQHVPVDQSDPSALIAWDVLKTVEDHQVKWGDNPWENKSWETEPDEFFKDKYIVDPWDGSRKMWSLGVNQEYKPLDPVPPNSAPRKGTRKNNDNIMEYSCSLWAKARAKRSFDPNQRVIEAQFISLRRNLLDEFDTPEEETPKKCFVILEPLKISALPTTVVAMAYIFPAIIHRLESYLIALEACDLLHLKIRPDFALEAVTKDSDNTDEHGNGQVNFQRGMGNNYERLEFLGDCFLKMATSISLFGIHPENNEYAYHVDRMLLICNANLKNNAVKLKLYEYIRSEGFNRRAWYPEGLKLLKGKTATAPNSHKLGDKSIADVCEALIGAALLTCHETKNMDNAVRAVTEHVSSENHQATCFADYYKLYKKPKYQVAAATEMQRNLASQLEQEHRYHFKYPRLARSAFTHPAYPFSYEHVPSYQRLEFLGDSLLDMACVSFLFHRYPTKDPQWLTEHKMAMVSNQFLGALCVALGFHAHLLLFNASFLKQIADYVTEVTEARKQAEEDAVRAGKLVTDCAPDYWIGVRQPPKCLPDIVEAYIGAIFVDSEYNYEEVERFFNTHIKWYFEDMSIYDSYANKHPTTFLTKFLQTNMGCAEWTIIVKEIKTIDGSKPSVVAMVIIHGQVVADAEAESSRYAKVAAASKAKRALEGLPLMEFRQQFCCDCRPDDLGSDDGPELHGTAV